MESEHAADVVISFDQTISILEDRLAKPLPGRHAQITMAPRRSDTVDRTDVEGRNCREAGVLALIHPLNGIPHVVVTVRRGHLADHAGQVAFPGGRRESDEPLLQTALREAQEEVALSPDDAVVLGELTPLYIPPSNYCVYPYVAYTRIRSELVPHDFEVERIVDVPIADLLDPERVRTEVWTVRGADVNVPFFDVAGLQIWGATAMMLSELVALLK